MGFVSGSRTRDSSNRQPLRQVLQRVATQQSITHVIYSLYSCPILGQLKSELLVYYTYYMKTRVTVLKMNGCNANYAEKYTCHVLKPYILLHFCVTATS